jgi:MFS family permease
MAHIDPAQPQAQSRRFLFLYALAVCGGAVAYIPFLTILLPVQVSHMAGDDALFVLARLAFIGAIMASAANIGFGWASDRTGSRRGWVAAGLILSSLLLVSMPWANSPAALIAMIAAWQLALNMMLAPLTAWAGDTVPDAQKGLLGGLLAFAPAAGALVGALVTLPGLAGDGTRLALVAAMVVGLVSPLLLFGRPHKMAGLMPQGSAAEEPAAPTLSLRTVVLPMWLARLFVQIAEAALFAFLLLWFRSVAPDFGENDAASTFAVILCAAVFATLGVGHWSDRADRPIVPLTTSAAMVACGLLVMSLATSLPMAIGGYVLFGLFSAVFLALHSSQTLRVLPSPRSRGRDLGLFNLTNTVPSLIMPWLALALVPTYGFDALLLLLSGLALVAALLLLSMPRRLPGQAVRRV